MSLRNARQMALIAIACVAVTTPATPVRAQMIVYDPSNYAQNVMQAARALQQINNQITNLQNQTQMLLNQAKNLASLQDALRVQAGVVGNLDTTRTETDALVSSSQSAVGALQALQADNQLVALQTRQLADLTAVIAAQSRAQSLAGARTSANQEQAREQLSRFLGGTQSYQPLTIQMFH